MSGAHYRSELHIPIKKDALSFQERQTCDWEEMEDRMRKRREEWEKEVERMRNEFFTLKPFVNNSNSDSKENVVPPATMNKKKFFIEDMPNGEKIFKIMFDTSEFNAEEINVRTEGRRLIIHARHEEKSGNSSVVKEFNRKVDIPPEIDIDRLGCVLSADGVLTVEAPLPTPGYSRLPPPQQQQQQQQQQAAAASSSLNALTPGVVTNRGAAVQPAAAPAPSNGQSLPNSNFAPSPPSGPEHSPIPSPPSMSPGRTAPATGPIVTDADGRKRLRLLVDIGSEFKPEDILVKTIDKKLIISAKHEEKTSGRTLQREFNKEYELPDIVDPQTVNAYFTEDGALTIEAPLKAAAPEILHAGPKFTISVCRR